MGKKIQEKQNIESALLSLKECKAAIAKAETACEQLAEIRIKRNRKEMCDYEKLYTYKFKKIDLKKPSIGDLGWLFGIVMLAQHMCGDLCLEAEELEQIFAAFDASPAFTVSNDIILAVNERFRCFYRNHFDVELPPMYFAELFEKVLWDAMRQYHPTVPSSQEFHLETLFTFVRKHAEKRGRFRYLNALWRDNQTDLILKMNQQVADIDLMLRCLVKKVKFD